MAVGNASDMMVDVALRGDLRMNGWVSIDDVRVVKFWRMRPARARWPC
jgi:hypothetical protein